MCLCPTLVFSVQGILLLFFFIGQCISSVQIMPGKQSIEHMLWAKCYGPVSSTGEQLPSNVSSQNASM